MSDQLSEGENTLLGGFAAVIETALLQPTMYAKNARQQNIPLTLDPRVYYRGIGPALASEMGQLSLQFGATSALKRTVFGNSPTGELGAASSAGALVALVASPCELLMIQQQRFGGGMLSTPARIVRSHGPMVMMRGLGPAMARDAIYVGSMLGATPVIHRSLEDLTGGGSSSANILAVVGASMLGGTFGAVMSHPFDTVKTAMQGDVCQKTYGGTLETARTLMGDAGLGRLFSGVFWRTVNITMTVYIANECALRLPSYVMAVTRRDPP